MEREIDEGLEFRERDYTLGIWVRSPKVHIPASLEPNFLLRPIFL